MKGCIYHFVNLRYFCKYHYLNVGDYGMHIVVKLIFHSFHTDINLYAEVECSPGAACFNNNGERQTDLLSSEMYHVNGSLS